MPVSSPRNIISEGDSWFQYPHIPFNNAGSLINELDRIIRQKKRYCLINDGIPLAHEGDTTTEMRQQEENKSRIRRLFRDRSPVRVLLFSGGGNDLIDALDNIIILQKGVQSGQQKLGGVSINKVTYNGVKENIKKNYKYFIKICQQNDAVLLSHTYTYPDVTKEGTKFIKVGPWFKTALRNKGYRKTATQKKFCEEIIKDFRRILGSLRKEHKEYFDFVDLTGIQLTNGDKSDEIHLTTNGYEKVAKKFIKKINGLYKGRNW